MSFTFPEYQQLIADQKFDEAFAYRCSNVPKILYKYFELLDDQICRESITNKCEKIEQKNEREFQALEKGLVWMPTFNNLNDPFEFKAVYLDKISLAEQGWQVKGIEKLLNGIKTLFLLTSLSENLTNNMPMWTHYANNHQGFCIEYRITNPRFIYPISYEAEKMGIASSLMPMLSKFTNCCNVSANDPELRFYYYIMYHMSIMKHKSWGYEKEYRAIYYNHRAQKSGDLVPLTDLGLEAAKIYVGVNCTVENKIKLLHIAERLTCGIYEMYLDEYDPSFELRYRLLS